MSKPSIILVHGALVGTSIWHEVTPRLQAAGHVVHAPALPLRGLASDVAYLSAFLDTLEGPVILVGHSYSGSIISHPAFDRSSVAALIFLSAFAPDSGESTGELNGRRPGSKLGEATTIVRPYAEGSDLYLKPESFAEVYAANLDAEAIGRLSVSQRPIDVAALGESFEGSPAWRNRPAFMLISTDDASLVPEAQRFMAERADAVVREVASAHASPLSHAEAACDLIALAVDTFVPA